MTTEMVTAGSSALAEDEKVDSADLLATFGEKAENWVFIEPPPPLFFKNAPRAFIFGTVTRFFEIETEHGRMKSVVLRLGAPAIVNRLDEDNQLEDVEAAVGDEVSANISSGNLEGRIAELFGSLDAAIGKKILIIADQVIKTKKGRPFWSLRVGCPREPRKG